jgi:hypothetical protein
MFAQIDFKASREVFLGSTIHTHEELFGSPGVLGEPSIHGWALISVEVKFDKENCLLIIGIMISASGFPNAGTLFLNFVDMRSGEFLGVLQHLVTSGSFAEAYPHVPIPGRFNMGVGDTALTLP